MQPILKYFYLFDDVKDYDGFTSSIKEGSELLNSSIHPDDKTYVLQQICDNIFNQINQSYIDRWINENPQLAIKLLTEVEKSSGLLNIYSIRLAETQVKSRMETLANSYQTIIEKIASFLDSISLTNLSLSSKGFYSSPKISIKLLERHGLSNTIWKDDSLYLIPKSFIYRQVINSGANLLSLGRYYSYERLQIFNEELTCFENKCPNLSYLDVSHRSSEHGMYLFPKSLTSLSFSGKWFETNIGNLPEKLTQLNLESSVSHLTRVGFQNLPKNLKQLNISFQCTEFHPEDLPRGLTHLSLHINGITNVMFVGCNWPQLKKLTLQAYRIDDICCLINLPNSLEILEINISELTNKDTLDFEHLSNCKEMTILADTKELLRKLPKELQKLKINACWNPNDPLLFNTDLKDLWIYFEERELVHQSIYIPPFLTNLRISSDFNENTTYNFDNLINLKAFCISLNWNHEERYLELKKVKFLWSNNLKYIRLSGMATIDSQDFINLPRGLKSLAIFLKTFVPLHLQNLPPNLEDLYLYCDRFNSDDVKDLPKTLKHLSLAKGYYEGVFNISILNTLQNLESLEISNFEIDPLSLDLLSLKKLKKFTFNFVEELINITPKNREDNIDLLRKWANNQTFEVIINEFLDNKGLMQERNYTMSADVAGKSLKELDKRAGILDW